MSIITKVVSSNPAHGEVYSKQQYVIKFVSDLGHVGGIPRVFQFPPPIKLKVALNTITIPLMLFLVTEYMLVTYIDLTKFYRCHIKIYSLYHSSRLIMTII